MYALSEEPRTSVYKLTMETFCVLIPLYNYLAPSGPPQNVSVESTGTESVGIVVKWDEVIPDERNGIILGYKVTYWKDIIKRTVHVRDSTAREVEIIRLEYLTEYKVQVLAYTSVGEGPDSPVLTVTTDETSMFFKSSSHHSIAGLLFFSQDQNLC